jgi:hypothetical protein
MKIKKSKAKVEFMCETSYPAQHYTLERDAAIRKLAKKFKADFSGAGMGFGYRDNGFSFTNTTDRDKFVKALDKAKKTLKVTKCYLGVYVDE